MTEHVTRGDDTLARLADIVDSRHGGDPDKSYVARLFAKGTDAILKKVGEEATEVVMAAKDGVPERVVGEVADLWFHCLVALSHLGLRPEQVLAELRRREGLSGLEEFALRKSVRREAEPGHGRSGGPTMPGEEPGQRPGATCKAAEGGPG